MSAEFGVITNNSKVSSWGDQSGANNNAGQIVATRQTTQVTGVINGHPVIRFDGIHHALDVTDAASLQWGTDDFVIAVVANFKNSATTGASYGLLYSKQLETGPFPGPSLWGNLVVSGQTQPVFALQIQGGATYNAATPSSKPLNDGNIRLYAGRRTGGTNLEVRVNGAQAGVSVAASTINLSAVGQPLHIGGHLASDGSFGQALDGDIAEIVAVHGSSTAAQLQTLESYLMKKYGL